MAEHAGLRTGYKDRLDMLYCDRCGHTNASGRLWRLRAGAAALQ